MSPRDRFKVGFLARCVEAGMGPVEIAGAARDARVKVAGVLDHILGMGKGVVDAGKDVASGALHAAWPVAAFGPPILGAAAGYGLARAGDISDTDVAEIKDRELVDEYRRQAEKLRRQRSIQQARADRPSPLRLYS